MRERQDFSDEALEALEQQKQELTAEALPVVVTEDFSEVLSLKRAVFNAVCRPGLSYDQREQAFQALTRK